MSAQKEVWRKSAFMMLTITLGVIWLYYTQIAILPLLFSIFLSFLVLPFSQKLERHGLNRFVAALIPILGLVLILAGILTGLFFQLKAFAADLPEFMDNMEKQGANFFDNMEQSFNLQGSRVGDMLREQVTNALSNGVDFAGQGITVTTSILTYVTLVPVMTFFIVLYRRRWKAFMLQIIPESKMDTTENVMHNLKVMLQQYLIGISVVVLIVSILNSLGLWLLGIKYPIVLGVVSAVLGIIPYLGVLIGAALPVLVAVATKDSIGYAFAVMAFYLVVQFIEGNMLTPKIVGSQTNINPLAVIIFLILASLLWGVAGMILAIPTLATLKIIFENVDGLKPLAMLVASEPLGDDDG